MYKLPLSEHPTGDRLLDLWFGHTMYIYIPTNPEVYKSVNVVCTVFRDTVAISIHSARVDRRARRIER